jgi:hypothetical protein
MRRTLVRGLVAAVGVAAGVCAAASTATAEVGAPAATVQAIAADAQFLEYAPPPAAPGVVCLIDSGVDPNPDTTPILAGSYALQPGADTDDELSKLDPPVEPGDHPNGHGTYMAMIMAAPVNGWGMVGIAPTSVRVFNLKALAGGQSTFSFAAYATSIEHCVARPVGVSGLSVINLSLGSDDQPSQDDANLMGLAVADARNRGLDVVGAAGNASSSVAFPADASGVLAVGAADANPSNLGVFCASSNRGPALGVLAPGCGSQMDADGGGDGIEVAFPDDGTPAWASGTSEASAIVSAVLASMRAYAPSLTSVQAEGCVTATAVNGGNLDAAAAFNACGLGAIVDQGLAAYGAATATPPALSPPESTPSPKPTATVLSPPKSADSSAPWGARPRIVTTRVRAGRLVITVASVPKGAHLRVEAQRRIANHYRTVAAKTVGGRAAKLTRGHWDRAEVFFVEGARHSKAVALDPSGKPLTAATTRSNVGLRSGS